MTTTALIEPGDGTRLRVSVARELDNLIVSLGVKSPPYLPDDPEIPFSRTITVPVEFLTPFLLLGERAAINHLVYDDSLTVLDVLKNTVVTATLHEYHVRMLTDEPIPREKHFVVVAAVCAFVFGIVPESAQENAVALVSAVVIDDAKLYAKTLLKVRAFLPEGGC